MADPEFVNTVARLGPGTMTIASKTFTQADYAVGKGLFYYPGTTGTVPALNSHGITGGVIHGLAD